MEPRCDPVSDYNVYDENQQACHEMAIKIVGQLGPVIEMRHKLGEAMMTSEGRKTLPALKKGLSEAATPILDTYSKKEANCEKTDDTQSCIYAEQFSSFIKLFGPVVPDTAGSEHSPVSIEMAHLKSGYLVVPVEPKSSGYEVLLDTGANCTILSVDIANIFKDSIRILGQTQYGQKALSVAIKGMSFDLGGVKFEPTSGLISPVVDYLEGSDERHKLVAILGADILFHRSWMVDYDKSDLVLGQDVEKEISEGNRWSQVPLFPHPFFISYFVGGDVSINGNSFRFALDTGLNDTALIEQCPLPGAKTSNGGFSVTAEGMRELKEFENIPVKLGKNELNENVSVVPENSVNTRALHKAKLCGFLGNDILGRYNYMYDPKTLSLYIRPRDEKNIPRLWGTGITSGRTRLEGGSAAFIVAQITPETPAEKAGLKVGDIITEIDGMKSDSTSMLELIETFYPSKPEMPVTIIRNGETKKLTLRFER